MNRIQRLAAIFPESETDFFAKIAELQLHFQVDTDGIVSGMTILEGGKELRAQKIQEEKNS